MARDPSRLGVAHKDEKRRQSIRLKGYDYSRPGAYFVTVCVQDQRPLFGEVVGRAMIANEFGEIVRRCWEDLPNHYPHVTLDAFVVMPNHAHGTIVLAAKGTRGVGAGFKPAPTRPGDAIGTGAAIRHGLPEIVRAWKTYSARRINALRGTPGAAVWQRSYYEHVIRNERSLRRIREYIRFNPQNWRLDQEYLTPEREA